MKRTQWVSFMVCLAFSFYCISFLSVPVYADTAPAAAVWEENNFDIQVYEGTTRDYMYSIYYNGVDTEGVPIGQNVYLLMVNGGFVPAPGIIIKDNRAVAPAEIVCEVLGMEMDWNEENQTVSIFNDTTSMALPVNNKQAVVNGNAEPVYVTAEIINSKIYVPVRFISESIGAKVQYITNINKLAQTDGNIYDGISYNEYVNNVKAVVIETDSAAAPVYTVDDGLKAIKSESEKAYKEVTDYLESQGGGFSDTQKDYDPDAIEYTNFDMGRYYVYQLQGFQNCPIFYNKYTGEIFMHHAGLPGVYVEKGFMNVSWLYQ